MNTDPQHVSWLNTLTSPKGHSISLSAKMRESLLRLDAALFAMWGLGDNVLLAWTHDETDLRVLSVRHYAIAETIYGRPATSGDMADPRSFINDLLSGPKHLPPQRFDFVCRAFGSEAQRIRPEFKVGKDVDIDLISEILRRYSVSLVRGRAVVLLDAVEFSLQQPLDQMAMLNSLSYSVNTAYRLLLSKEIAINFARTTTGDGFYIWNRDTGPDANIALYKLMMMILADNAIAQRKAHSAWVPRLRAAFHAGEHYEFHQVEGLNPTTFSYIVGQVTVDLSRMIEKALPGQILLGDFVLDNSAGTRIQSRLDTVDFVEKAAASVEQLKGLEVSGGRIDIIRCYLTGENHGGGRYMVNRYHVRDKHGTSRAVYNAKINIHRESAEPIYLGIQRDDMWAFSATKVEELRRDAEKTGSFFIRP